MKNFETLARDYDHIEQAIRFWENNVDHAPGTAEMARGIGLSQLDLQSLFRRWAGIGPERFFQFLAREYARKMLLDSKNILDLAGGSGQPGTARLYNLSVYYEVLSPGKHRPPGQGLNITYGFHPSPFGECLLAVTERGLCGLRFVQNNNRNALVDWLPEQWPGSNRINDPAHLEPFMQQIFDFSSDRDPAPVQLYVQGTAFQLKVWQALLKIPPGKVVTYSDIARHMGLPLAARAVGNAVGKNPIPLLIPCHRVIRKSGEFGHYGEGPARKKALLGWEAARSI